MKRKTMLATLLLAAGLVLSGMTAMGAEAQIESISVCAGSEDALDVNVAHAGTLEAFSSDRHCFEGLYKLDAEGNTVLGQASDVVISEDGLTWTFTLRDDITWSDGQAVTPEDFIFGFQYLKDEANDYSAFLDMISKAEAPDDKTLVLNLAYPCGYLPSVLSLPVAYPVRQDYVEEYGEAYATDPEKCVYNGAYAITEWTHQASLVMEKRDDYYNADEITVGRIEWQLMTDNTTKQSAFQNGEIIFSDSVVEEQAAMMEGNGLQVAPGYNTYCAMFNLDTGNDVLKDAKVRKALMLAVDRERLINIRSLNDTMGYTYTPEGLANEEGVEFNTTVAPWFSDDYEANCEEAKQLLAEAGYENGEGFPALRYIVGNEDRKQIAEAVVGDWNLVLGIDSITVETVENFFNARNSGDYDIAYFGWFMDYDDISNMLGTMCTGQNDAHYANEEYDAAYNAAASETDQALQWEKYAACEAILAEDVPVAPFFHSQNNFLFDDANYSGLVFVCGNAYFGYLTQNA